MAGAIGLGSGGLPERELSGLLEILGEVHHAEDVEAFRRGLIDVMPRVLRSDCTAYNEIAPDGSPLVVLVDPTPDPALLDRWARYAHQSPLIQWHLRTRDPRAQRMSDVSDQAAFRATDLYREVFVPLGVEHQMAVTLPAPPTLLIGLTVATTRDYSEAERKMLDLARPHLIQARANAASRQRVRAILAAVEQGLDESGEAIVVVDERERVEFATRGGQEVLGMLAPGSGPSATALPAELRGLDADGASVAEVATPEGTLAVRRITTAGLAVYVFERRGGMVSQAVLERLGLSPREAQVLQQLMGGASTRATAEHLGISSRTVHKHAEHLYAKLGVHDRIAAVSAAWAAIDAGRAPTGA